MKKQTIALVMVFLGMTSPVMAHTGIGISHGFMAGFAHPWQGMDHLLVMFAIGLWACTLGGRALWALPTAFLLSMAAGAALGFAGFTLPDAELWVTLSMLACGLATGFNWRPSPVLATGLVSIFAMFHGFVHAGEISSNVGQWSYAAGFLLTTAMLHGAGISVGLLSAKTMRSFRLAFGLFCTTAGLFMLAGY